ncbi:hypothetical protein CLHUN_17210 [Ruminiclostridium hungatei]|uniref:GIY-YIG domain-containing protein n=1 Tax=Ruminiclostridium hungatei TaxID=48256 RepID=A0A1V4SKK4_RUMHU|nr:GIY-YIG nuclease family protein [Ruminiclostridium hungatei]OPX44422.1 hypothetical protein CLHUN_17210 [Ruminiclostridium hungatei]
MDKARKRELQQEYANTKQPMGVFLVRCKSNNKCHIQATPDLKGVMNGTYVRLSNGRHPNRELRKEWNELGEEGFVIEILEQLPYDEKDPEKKDYSQELALLQSLWEEKLAGEGQAFYMKRLT